MTVQADVDTGSERLHNDLLASEETASDSLSSCPSPPAASIVEPRVSEGTTTKPGTAKARTNRQRKQAVKKPQNAKKTKRKGRTPVSLVEEGAETTETEDGLGSSPSITRESTPSLTTDTSYFPTFSPAPTPPSNPIMQTPHTGRMTRNRKLLAEGKPATPPTYNLRTLLSMSDPAATTPKVKPRWYNQTYILFLTLRKAGEPLPRGKLIPAALELDRQISMQRGLPRLFGGKTPQNTASGILTENRDKLFVPFIPEGKKHVHFKLSYEPGNFETALQNYEEWMDTLIKMDWPYLFSRRRREWELAGARNEARVRSEMAERNKSSVGSKTLDEGKSDMEKTGKDPAAESGSKTEQDVKEGKEGVYENGKELNSVKGENIQSGDIIIAREEHDVKVELATETPITLQDELRFEGACTPLKRKHEELPDQVIKDDIETSPKRSCLEAPDVLSSSSPSALNENSVSTEAKALAVVKRTEAVRQALLSGSTAVPETHDGDSLAGNGLFDPDPDDNIPKSIHDVLEVKDSSIPNSGRGLFATRDIPAWTILGFYFGVPMTEDEFDSLKEPLGVASQYAHRYRLTILDGTDADGQPYWNHPRVFCPFHFMNEDANGANVAFVEGQVVNQVLCMAIRDITGGEELFANYGKEIARTWDGGGSARPSLKCADNGARRNGTGDARTNGQTGSSQTLIENISNVAPSVRSENTNSASDTRIDSPEPTSVPFASPVKVEAGPAPAISTEPSTFLDDEDDDLILAGSVNTPI